MKKLLMIACMLCFSAGTGKAQWVQITSGGGTIRALLTDGSYVYAGGSSGGGFFRSTDNGGTWSPSNTGLTTGDVRALARQGTALFAGTQGGGVFISADSGSNWTASNSGITGTGLYVKSFALIGTNLFAGTSAGVYHSTNGGSDWVSVNTGLTNTTVRWLTVSGTNLFAATAGGVFLSANNGAQWTAVNTGLSNLDVVALAVSGPDIFAGIWGGGGGVFKSTDNGGQWTAVNSGLTTTNIRCFVVIPGGALYVGTNAYGSVYSFNGASWTTVNTGLSPTADVQSLAVNSSYMFAGTGGSNVSRRPLSELIDVKDNRWNPASIELRQNYPNPFNPSTTFEFTLPVRGYVSLKIYNALGQEIETLISKEMNAGPHKILWNAGHLSSGVYFYKLNTGDISKTKKLLLIK